MEDSQLRVLIEKYDPEMSQTDVEYLMQHQDREQVINTLYTKLMEQHQLSLQLYGEQGALLEQYQEMVNDATLYYEDDMGTEYTLEGSTN